VDALGQPDGVLIQEPVLKAILVTDVCAGSYIALGETLSVVLERSSERMKALTEEIVHETDSIPRTTQQAAAAGPVALDMANAITAFRALEYHTLEQALTLNGDFLKFIDRVADETALAILAPPEPRMSTALLAVAWDKLIDDAIDAASLFVVAVMKKMREQLPNASAATSYLAQLDSYTKSAQKAVTVMEALRQMLLAGLFDQHGVTLNYQVLESRVAAAVKYRSQAAARQLQSP